MLPELNDLKNHMIFGSQFNYKIRKRNKELININNTKEVFDGALNLEGRRELRYQTKEFYVFQSTSKCYFTVDSS